MIALTLSVKSYPSSYQIGKQVISFDNAHDAEMQNELVWLLVSLKKANFFNTVSAEHSMG